MVWSAGLAVMTSASARHRADRYRHERSAILALETPQVLANLCRESLSTLHSAYRRNVTGGGLPASLVWINDGTWSLQTMPAVSCDARLGQHKWMSTNRENSKRNRLRDLSEIAKLINHGRDLHTVLRRLTRGICVHSGWSMSGIQALDMTRRQLISITRYDPYSDLDAPFPTGWHAATSPIESVLASAIGVSSPARPR